jgi:hypothetical protein
MQPSNPEDKQYEKWGVAPPARQPHGSDDDIAKHLQPTKHKWHQEGPVLICTSCPFPHATEPIFKDYILQGTDDQGLPMLKKLLL